MRAGLDAGVEIGLPILEDFDDPRSLEGAARILINALGDVRWNAAFAYLDPARDRPNLRILPEAVIDRLRFDGTRATGTIIHVDGHQLEVAADRFVLAAGAYGSPAILLRSGIGPADDLVGLSIDVRADVPGVGRNLIDHPRSAVTFMPSPDLLAQHLDHLAARRPRAQTLIKGRSDVCPPGVWDLQIMMRVRESFSSDPGLPQGEQLAHLFVHVMKPESRGAVRIDSPDPHASPIVDHGFLTDPDGRDAATLVSGIRFARRLAEARAMEGVLRDELAPGTGSSDHDLSRYVHRSVGGYWHPVGTCRMGPSTDAQAVVDPSGRLHGFTNVYVADASIMPTIPRANTHLPVIAVAERLAALLCQR
jgi:choline dehydrogenase